jgi:hypothetical protein
MTIHVRQKQQRASGSREPVYALGTQSSINYASSPGGMRINSPSLTGNPRGTVLLL